MLLIQFNRAPDDEWLFRPKHVERLTGINKILYKSVISLEFFLELIHDARNDEHKIHLPDVADLVQILMSETLTVYNYIFHRTIRQ
jgi:hypothetical protein